MVRATNKKFTVEVPAGEPITPELVTMVQGYRKAKPKTEAAKKFVTEKLAHAAATDGQQALDADRERTTAADEKPTSLLAKVKKSMSKKKVAAPAEKAPEPVVSPEVKPAKKAAEKASGVAPAVEKASRTVYAGRVLKKHGIEAITPEMIAELNAMCGVNDKESKWALRTGQAIVRGYIA